MELPPELREWSELLLLMQPDLSLSLGGMVRRLAAVLGTASGSPLTGRDEPDGYSGLATRGPYERLLPAEWLLATEMPEEFQRRAVMGEHVFYQRALNQPAAASMSVALFDCGPGQLGAPRLAHLALLIVLQRRADAARMEFRWGTLQNPQVGLQEALTRENLSQLLQARSLFDPQPWDLDDWAGQMETLDGSPELWIIRSRDTSTALLVGNEVTVGDADVPGENALLVEIARGNRLQPLELPLPPPEQGVRLLRNPFRRSAVRSGSVSTVQGANGLLFSQNAKRIAILHPSGGVSIYSVPNRSAEEVAPARHWEPRPGHMVTGMRLHRKQVTALTHDGVRLYLDGYTGGTFAGMLPMLGGQSESLALDATWHGFRTFQVNTGEKGRNYMYLVDDHRRLLMFESDRAANVCAAQFLAEPDEEVVGAALAGDTLWVALNGDSLKVQCHKAGRVLHEEMIALTTTSDRQVRWLPRTMLGNDEHPLLAYTSGANDWIIRRPLSGAQKRQVELPLVRVTIPADAEVLGVLIMRGEYFGANGQGNTLFPSLAYLTPDRRYVIIASRGELARTELHEPDGIHQYTWHGPSQSLAYRTGSGEVMVYNIRRQLRLLRLGAGA